MPEQLSDFVKMTINLLCLGEVQLGHAKAIQSCRSVKSHCNLLEKKSLTFLIYWSYCIFLLRKYKAVLILNNCQYVTIVCNFGTFIKVLCISTTVTNITSLNNVIYINKSK